MNRSKTYRDLQHAACVACFGLMLTSEQSLAQTILNAPGVTASGQGSRAQVELSVLNGGALNARIGARGAENAVGYVSAVLNATPTGPILSSTSVVSAIGDARAKIRAAQQVGSVTSILNVPSTAGTVMNHPVMAGASSQIDQLSLTTSGNLANGRIESLARSQVGPARASIDNLMVNATSISDLTIRAVAVGAGQDPLAQITGVTLRANRSITGVRLISRAVGNHANTVVTRGLP